MSDSKPKQPIYEVLPEGFDWKSQDKSFWQTHLPPLKYEITRESGTERAFTGALLDEKRTGVYRCTCCGLSLFSSKTKFDSGSGWPSFFQPLENQNLALHTDFKFLMKRTEVQCSRCGAHLGHVFDDGPEPTGKRYCINSASLDFKETNSK